MRQTILRLVLLAAVLLVIFGVYRLLTIEPIETGAFFDPDGWPLALAEAGGGLQAASSALAGLQSAPGVAAGGFYFPAALDAAGQLVDPAGDSSLEEWLARFPDTRFVVQLVQPDLQSLAALLHAVDSQNARGRVLAVVDDQQLVDALRTQAPDLATAMTTAETDSFLLTSRLRLTPFYRPAAPALLLPAGQFNEHTANAAHSRGIAVLVVSQEDATGVQGWIQRGADGVVVQNP